MVEPSGSNPTNGNMDVTHHNVTADITTDLANEGFKLVISQPRGKKRRTVLPPQRAGGPKKPLLPVNNSFQPLTRLSENDESANKINADSPSSTQAPAPPRVKPPPPIICEPPISQVDLIAALKKYFKDYSISSNRKESRIYASNIADYKNIIELLRRSNVQFHTFAPRGTERSKKYILYGFDRDFPVEEIHAGLNEKLSGINKVYRLSRVDEKGVKSPTFSVVVICDRKITIKNLTDIGGVCGVRFRVSTFKERPGPSMCYNCSQYGHTQKYCGHNRACAWCGGPHFVNECPKTAAPVCRQCGGDHVTSFRNCPKRLQLVEKTKSARANRKAPPTVAPPPAPASGQYVNYFPSLPPLVNPWANQINQQPVYTGQALAGITHTALPPVAPGPAPTSVAAPFSMPDPDIPPWAQQLFQMVAALSETVKHLSAVVKASRFARHD